MDSTGSQSERFDSLLPRKQRAPAREVTFVAAERDQAQTIARERYRRQNDSGFSYQGGKKSFDALVKEAEQEIIKKKVNDSLHRKLRKMSLPG